jgi:hypothetical protein
MNERKDEKWLDERLKRAVDGATPAFDVQAWKQKYAREFQILLGRSGQPSQSSTGRTVRLLLRGSIGKLAIAAAILATAGVLLVGRFGLTSAPPVPTRPPGTPQSPAQMVSMISLSAAFRSGGMEGLDKQCDRALERLGPRPSTISMQELFKDIDGKGLGKAKI